MGKINKKCINPPDLFSSRQYGFSQIVVAGTGKNVFISGQVAWDENFKITGKEDLAIQTEKSLDNLKSAINSAGGTMDDIVMLRIYIVNYKREYGSIINQSLKKYFGTESPPASTWISVQELANEDFLIEIEAQAVI
jgi:enamine deaminase RidA (YjgF/YER057c/UK114 family)